MSYFNNTDIDALSYAMTAAYHLQETTGTRTDSHASYDLADNNTVGYSTSGISGNAGDFERDNAEYLSLTMDENFDPDDDFAISMWVKLESAPADGEQQYLWTFTDEDDKAKIRGYYRNIGGVYSLQFSVKSSEFTANGMSITTTLSTGTWYHIIFTTIDDAGKFAAWVNGSKTTGSSFGVWDGHVGNFFVGTTCNSGIKSSYWDGLIDEVYYWNNMSTPRFSDEAATALYNSGSGRFYSAQ